MLAAVFFPATGKAFVYRVCTEKDPIIWASSDSPTFFISEKSIPQNSDAWNDIVDMMTEWEAIGGSDIDFHYAADENADGQAITGDGRSEILFVSEETLDEDLENEYIVFGRARWMWWWSASDGCYLSETDIVFNADVNFKYDDPVDFHPFNVPLAARPSFAHVALHELGHAMGLEHANDYASMLQGQMYEPHPGDTPYLPLPDDRAAARFLYPGEGGETDVAASFYKYDAANVNYYNYADGYVYEDVCPDDSIEVQKTVLNMGSQTETVEVGYYFSTDTVITADDVLAKIDDTTVSANADTVSKKDITVPRGLEYGATYYVGFILDPDDELAEFDESNNASVMGKVTLAYADDCGDAVPLELNARASSDYEGLDFYESPLWESPEMSATEAAAYEAKAGEAQLLKRAQKAAGVYDVTVDSVTPKWVGSEIYSTLALTVNEAIAGKKSRTLKLRQFGGVIDEGKFRYGMGESDAPEFKAGERFIVFLAGPNKAGRPFLDGRQGVLRVNSDSEHGDIVTDYEGRKIFESKNNRPLSPAGLKAVIGD